MDWLVIPLVAFIVLAIAGWFYAYYEHQVAAMFEQSFMQAGEQLKTTMMQRDKLNRENEALHKHVEIMIESLKVAQAEVERLLKSADHATIPLTEAITPEQENRYRAVLHADKPVPKRPTRKKAETQQ